MSNATYRQVGRWRKKKRSVASVSAFCRKWYKECGVWPGSRDVAIIFKMGNDAACKLLREARAVMEQCK